MTLTRGFIRNAVTTPLDARLMDMAQIVCNADGSPRTGIMGAATPSAVGTLGTMNVAIFANEYVVSKGKADGVVVLTNDGTVNVAIAAAPGSNSRIDVIYVKHNDNTTGDANSLPIFGAVTGTAAASPTKPALPTGALELATLRVYTGTSATNGGSNTLTQTAAFTASRGGTVPFRTKAELVGWTTAPAYAEATVIADGTSGFNGKWINAPGGWRPVGSATTRRTRSAAFNLPTTLAVLDLDNSVENSGDFTYAAGVFTCVNPGRYLVSAGLAMQAAGAAVGFLGRVSKNNVVMSQAVGITSTLGGITIFTATSLAMMPGDTIGLIVFTNTAIGMDVSQPMNFLDILRVGG